MAKNGYDQTYEDDRKENEETRTLVKKAAMAPINAIKPKATKPDTGETTNPMGDKYKKGGAIKCGRDGIAQRGKTKGRNV
jgi:hypothetical protein